MNTLIGQKEKMSHAYIEGQRVPVTFVKTGPCIVTQIKNMDKDGYWGIQLGFGDKKLKNTTKGQKGHLRGVTKDEKAPRFLREVRFEAEPKMKVGDVITATDIFKKGDVISISGISKGKGFAGVVKRHHFAGGPKTHGQSDRHRAPGSIGQGTTPGRVLKGKRMGGRMGNEQITVKNLIVVDINPNENLLAISGAVPGKSGGLVTLTKLHSGKLDELVQEAPVAQIAEGEGTEETKAVEPEVKE